MRCLALAGFFVLGALTGLVMSVALPESVRGTVEAFHEVPGNVTSALAETLPPTPTPRPTRTPRPTATPVPTPTPLAVDPEVWKCFKSSECSGWAKGPLPKWPSSTIRVYVDGPPGEHTNQVHYNVDRALDEIAPLLGLIVVKAPTRTAANLAVFAAPDESGPCGPYSYAKVSGCADRLAPSVRSASYTAEVKIFNPAYEPHLYGVVLHELTHALVGMEHVEGRKSLMNLLGRNLTDMDRALLTLAGSAIDRAGVRREDVAERVHVPAMPTPTPTLPGVRPIGPQNIPESERWR